MVLLKAHIKRVKDGKVVPRQGWIFICNGRD